MKMYVFVLCAQTAKSKVTYNQDAKSRMTSQSSLTFDIVVRHFSRTFIVKVVKISVKVAND